ncbi:prepilin peptidase [Terrarubrum flagellatum]|uniref:A24 family peptidase n=1 Tax=Terrirubrum flagellatum TaxID=2895980 RepID=UPI0031451384
MTDWTLLILFPALLAYAAVSDMLTMTISNRVSLLLIAGFFPIAALIGLPWQMIGFHTLAALLVLIVTFGMFTAGWMGGGDAKLASATALWLGFSGLLDYVLVTAMAGGVLTLFLLKARNYPLPAIVAGWGWSRRLHSAKSGIPYGIALAFSGLIVYPQTDIWRLALGG